MDYKFIEQLLERYFAAETTAEEESLLRAGMAMPDLPEHIAKYREIFECMRSEGEKGLGEDFDQHIMQVCGVAEQPRITVRAQRRSLLQNLRPLWQAAAAVAIFALVGIGAGRSFNDWESHGDDSQIATGTDAEQVVKPAIVNPAQQTASADTLKMEL